MAKVAVIIDDLFEDSEYTGPAEAFKDAGHQLIHIGKEKGRKVEGKKDKTPVSIDVSIDHANANDYDALLIPGGYSPDKLRADPNAVNFAKSFMDANKPVFSICHGAQLLISADALRNRKATGWKSIKQDIKNAGAEFLDEEVVVDRNLVTSRQPSDIPAFNKACLKLL
ncbi:MAG: general stress protein 18 [Chlamydiales bacterium]